MNSWRIFKISGEISVFLQNYPEYSCFLKKFSRLLRNKESKLLTAEISHFLPPAVKIHRGTTKWLLFSLLSRPRRKKKGSPPHLLSSREYIDLWPWGARANSGERGGASRPLSYSQPSRTGLQDGTRLQSKTPSN